MGFWYSQKNIVNKTSRNILVKAASEIRDIEYFRYDWVIHTRNPNVLLLAPIIDNGEITADLAAHIKPDGKYRDHGLYSKYCHKT